MLWMIPVELSLFKSRAGMPTDAILTPASRLSSWEISLRPSKTIYRSDGLNWTTLAFFAPGRILSRPPVTKIGYYSSSKIGSLETNILFIADTPFESFFRFCWLETTSERISLKSSKSSEIFYLWSSPLFLAFRHGLEADDPAILLFSAFDFLCYLWYYFCHWSICILDGLLFAGIKFLPLTAWALVVTGKLSIGRLKVRVISKLKGEMIFGTWEVSLLSFYVF